MKKIPLKENHVGIVLKTTEHKENGSIIKAFCADGIISAIVRGTQKINSKTRLIAQTLTKIDFMVTVGHQINTLTEGAIVDNFSIIKEDNAKMLIAWMFLEKIEKLNIEIDDCPVVYEFFEKCLELLKTTKYPLALLSYFEVKLLYFLGVAPTFNGCAHCGKTSDKSCFSIDNGGVICRNCQGDRSYDLDSIHTQALKILYLIRVNEIDDTVFSAVDHCIKHIQFVLDRYYEYYLGFVTKSKRIHQQLY